MTKVKINPGICGLLTTVEAYSEDGLEVTIKVDSMCPSVTKMFDELVEYFDSYEICLCRPGSGPLYDYASKSFPGHCSCTTVAGITKAVEVACKLALPKDTSIHFE